MMEKQIDFDMKSKKPFKRQGGFSLVEVTLAIGITAVALVSLMGMLPRGIKNLQRASDKAVMGRIHQQIMGEIQLTSWEVPTGGASAGKQAPIEDFDGMIKYYDDQGIELSRPSTEEEKFRHVYTARINLPKPGESVPTSVGKGNYSGASLPGDGGTSSKDRFLRLVLVEITSNVDERFLSNPSSGFDDLNYPGAVFTYRTMIAKMGQQFGDPKES